MFNFSPNNKKDIRNFFKKGFKVPFQPFLTLQRSLRRMSTDTFTGAINGVLGSSPTSMLGEGGLQRQWEWKREVWPRYYRIIKATLILAESCAFFCSTDAFIEATEYEELTVFGNTWGKGEKEQSAIPPLMANGPYRK